MFFGFPDRYAEFLEHLLWRYRKPCEKHEFSKFNPAVCTDRPWALLNQWEPLSSLKTHIFSVILAVNYCFLCKIQYRLFFFFFRCINLACSDSERALLVTQFLTTICEDEFQVAPMNGELRLDKEELDLLWYLVLMDSVI